MTSTATTSSTSGPAPKRVDLKCAHCTNLYSSKKSLLLHIRRAHPDVHQKIMDIRNSKLSAMPPWKMCPKCGEPVCSPRIYARHLENAHKDGTRVEKKRFDSMDAFEHWRQDITSGRRRFVKMQKLMGNNKIRAVSWFCAHTVSKRGATKKKPAMCPAFIHGRVCRNAVEAEFCFDHAPHCDLLEREELSVVERQPSTSSLPDFPAYPQPTLPSVSPVTDKRRPEKRKLTTEEKQQRRHEQARHRADAIEKTKHALRLLEENAEPSVLVDYLSQITDAMLAYTPKRPRGRPRKGQERPPATAEQSAKERRKAERAKLGYDPRQGIEHNGTSTFIVVSAKKIEGSARTTPLLSVRRRRSPSPEFEELTVVAPEDPDDIHLAPAGEETQHYQHNYHPAAANFHYRHYEQPTSSLRYIFPGY